MKLTSRIIIVFFALNLLFSCTSSEKKSISNSNVIFEDSIEVTLKEEPEPIDYLDYDAITIGKGLKLRANPRTDADVVATFNTGELVKITHQTDKREKLTEETSCDEYGFYWTAAVKGEDAYGEPADADFNDDGFITMDEAFQYAEEHDAASESPQYGDYPENIGAEITLWKGSDPPETPEKPEGPDEWILYVDTTFSSITTDPEEDSIYYMFDWGDGTNSGWVGPYGSGQTGEATHNWTVLGDYEVKVIAKDKNDIESNWSEPTIISIVENEPPEEPDIQGPSVAKVKRLLEFTFTASDFEDHDIYFFISWGDGKIISWEGPYSANEAAIFSHSYSETGEYTISARAMDQYGEKGLQSSFKLKISNNRGVTNVLSQRFLEYIKDIFPNVFLILRYLMAL